MKAKIIVTMNYSYTSVKNLFSIKEFYLTFLSTLLPDLSAKNLPWKTINRFRTQKRSFEHESIRIVR